MPLTSKQASIASDANQAVIDTPDGPTGLAGALPWNESFTTATSKQVAFDMYAKLQSLGASAGDAEFAAYYDQARFAADSDHWAQYNLDQRFAELPTANKGPSLGDKFEDVTGLPSPNKWGAKLAGLGRWGLLMVWGLAILGVVWVVHKVSK